MHTSIGLRKINVTCRLRKRREGAKSPKALGADVWGQSTGSSKLSVTDTKGHRVQSPRRKGTVVVWAGEPRV